MKHLTRRRDKQKAVTNRSTELALFRQSQDGITERNKGKFQVVISMYFQAVLSMYFQAVFSSSNNCGNMINTQVVVNDKQVDYTESRQKNCSFVKFVLKYKP